MEFATDKPMVAKHGTAYSEKDEFEQQFAEYPIPLCPECTSGNTHVIPVCENFWESTGYKWWRKHGAGAKELIRINYSCHDCGCEYSQDYFTGNNAAIRDSIAWRIACAVAFPLLAFIGITSIYIGTICGEDYPWWSLPGGILGIVGAVITLGVAAYSDL